MSNQPQPPSLMFLCALFSLGLQGRTTHLSNMWRPSHPGGLICHMQWGTGLSGETSRTQPGFVSGGVRDKIQKSMCVTYFLPGHELSESCAAAEPWAPLKQSSPLVMWVHYRIRLILPSLVSPPSFTSPWTEINATPSPGSPREPNASTRTGTDSEG